jgi:hypothetical protein
MTSSSQRRWENRLAIDPAEEAESIDFGAGCWDMKSFKKLFPVLVCTSKINRDESVKLFRLPVELLDAFLM